MWKWLIEIENVFAVDYDEIASIPCDSIFANILNPTDFGQINLIELSQL